jgi:dihydrofolate reductase
MSASAPPKGKPSSPCEERAAAQFTDPGTYAPASIRCPSLQPRGLERALEQARAVAGAKDVGVGAASIVQQCIRAGLLDEIHIDLVPVLLGGGVSLFDHLGSGPIDLERTRVIEGAGVTHLTFRVLK